MTVKPQPRPYRNERRAAAAGETRARIVAAARTLLGGGRNLPAFSVDAVAKHAGVTRLTVYNQFESKRGLLEAVFDDIAREGGLTELPAIFAEPDIDKALRRFVAVFCRFWSMHGKVMPKLSAVTKLDDEVAASLEQRTERRRHALTALVKRVVPKAGKRQGDLVDVLYSLTGFEMFEALSVRDRSAESIEKLMRELVEETVRRYRAD